MKLSEKVFNCGINFSHPDSASFLIFDSTDALSLQRVDFKSVIAFLYILTMK